MDENGENGENAENGTNDRRSARTRFAEAARSPRPDLARLCLLIGEVARPAPDARPAGGGPPAGSLVDEAEIELDRLAGLLPFASGRTPAAWAEALAALLGRREGFGGVAADYRRLESSLLDEVLRRRRGLPITLSVVWMEVARRAGAPVHGVALPGHFVVGFGDPQGDHVLADPFAGGAPLTEEDAGALVAGSTGGRPSKAAFGPASPLEIVLRILNNIRRWASARPERSDVALWAVELSLLLPHHPVELRHEHARLVVRRGDFLTGAEQLDAYAELIDDMEPTAAESARREAQAARARLN